MAGRRGNADEGDIPAVPASRPPPGRPARRGPPPRRGAATGPFRGAEVKRREPGTGHAPGCIRAPPGRDAGFSGPDGDRRTAPVAARPGGRAVATAPPEPRRHRARRGSACPAPSPVPPPPRSSRRRCPRGVRPGGRSAAGRAGPGALLDAEAARLPRRAARTVLATVRALRPAPPSATARRVPAGAAGPPPRPGRTGRNPRHTVPEDVEESPRRTREGRRHGHGPAAPRRAAPAAHGRGRPRRTGCPAGTGLSRAAPPPPPPRSRPSAREGPRPVRRSPSPSG